MSETTDIVPFEEKIDHILTKAPESAQLGWATGKSNDPINELNDFLLYAAWKELTQGMSKDEVDAIRNNPVKLAKKMAEAAHMRMEATVRLLENSVLDRGLLMQSVEAQKTGWIHMLDGKPYRDVRELLEGMIGPGSSLTSRRSDIQFLVNTLLPALEYFNIDPTLLTRDPKSFSKARLAVPGLRWLWNRMSVNHQKEMRVHQDDDGTWSWSAGIYHESGYKSESAAIKGFQKSAFVVANEKEKLELVEMIEYILNEIADTEVTADAFEEEIRIIRTGDSLPVANAHVFILARERELVVLETNPTLTGLIQKRLSKPKIADGFMPGDITKFIELVNNTLRVSNKLETYVFDEPTGTMIKVSNKTLGVMLPDQKTMKDLARSAIASNVEAMMQGLESMEEWIVPIYPIAKAAPDLVKNICNAFFLPNIDDKEMLYKLVLIEIPDAILKLYGEQIMEAINAILPVQYKAEAIVQPMFFIGEWGIGIKVHKRKERQG